MLSSICKDFLAGPVMLNSINNRSRELNKGEQDTGHKRARLTLAFREAWIDQIVSIYNGKRIYIIYF